MPALGGNIRNKLNILLTGGAGYIGSHTAVALLREGYTPIIFDNYSNSTPYVIKRLEKITGHEIIAIRGDVNDYNLLADTLQAHQCNAVIHLAAHKSVGESTRKPLKYFANNIGGTLTLLSAMEKVGCKKLVFSSSATVYGGAKKSPIDEISPLEASNPYTHTKLVAEQILASIVGVESD